MFYAQQKHDFLFQWIDHQRLSRSIGQLSIVIEIKNECWKLLRNFQTIIWKLIIIVEQRMPRSINLNLIALSVQKNIEFSVQDISTLQEISEEMAVLYKNCDKTSFKYRKTDQSKELPLPLSTTIASLVQPNQNQLILYVECENKKTDACCIIY